MGSRIRSSKSTASLAEGGFVAAGCNWLRWKWEARTGRLVDRSQNADGLSSELRHRLHQGSEALFFATEICQRGLTSACFSSGQAAATARHDLPR